MLFLQVVLNDLGTRCGTSTTRDLKTISRRVEHEGLSFLTITLSNFGAELQKALDQGYVGHDQFSSFKRTGGLPRIFGGFLDLVFDRGSGRLLDDPDIDAIQALRQICLMWAKMNLPCTDARVAAAIEGYIECEREVRESDASLAPDKRHAFNRIGTLLWSNAFASCDRKIYNGEVIPKHGPGATAEKLRGNSKWTQAEWTWRLERMFPFGEHLAPSWRYFMDLPDVLVRLPGAERPVRVITVPKTLKTPRIIAIEPACMQYVQQGVLAILQEGLQQDDLCWNLVGWSSQVPNQRLAREGSLTGALATLDLSEASDRVSNQHVRSLLRNHGLLAEAVDASRSRKADVPGRGVIRLAKFASMGSALCFPMEAMVFATIIFVGIEDALNRQLTRKDIKLLSRQVRVYGDDIIVPVEYVSPVIKALEDFGLRVNLSKSFWNGKFRESCGKDYYDGHDVSIVRLRSVFPSSLADVSEIVSTLSTRNQLYKAGLWGAARHLDTLLGKILPLPRVSEQSPVLGRHSFLGPDLSGKLSEDTHQPLVYGGKLFSKLPASPLEGYGALLKCLTTAEYSQKEDSAENYIGLPSSVVSHLERSGRPLAVDIKLRWGPAA